MADFVIADFIINVVKIKQKPSSDMANFTKNLCKNAQHLSRITL